MHRHAEMRADAFGETGRCQRRFGLPLLATNVMTRSELVSPPWPLRGGQQSGQPCTLEGGTRLVVRRAGQAERCRRATDRPAVDSHTPQHFVLDLHDIATVEEGIVVEERIGDVVGRRVQGVPARKVLPLRVVRGAAQGWTPASREDMLIHARIDQRCDRDDLSSG